MVDHIRTLLINPSDKTGYEKVHDKPADDVLALFGMTGSDTDSAVIDVLMPLVLAPDLSNFRKLFDSRVTPGSSNLSVYRHEYQECGDKSCVSLSLTGVFDKLVNGSGRWAVSSVFSSDDPVVAQNLDSMFVAFSSSDAVYAIGAILIACAYRRLVLQKELR